MTYAETRENAFAMAEDAIAGWIASAIKNGESIPVEGDEPVEARRIVTATS